MTNGFVVWWDRMGFLLNQTGHLHSHSHGPSQPSQSHGHGHGHGHQRSHGSLAVRAAFIHALGDLVQSIGVLIAAYVVRFKVSWVTGVQYWERLMFRVHWLVLHWWNLRKFSQGRHFIRLMNWSFPTCWIGMAGKVKSIKSIAFQRNSIQSQSRKNESILHVFCVKMFIWTSYDIIKKGYGIIMPWMTYILFWSLNSNLNYNSLLPQFKFLSELVCWCTHYFMDCMSL